MDCGFAMGFVWVCRGLREFGLAWVIGVWVTDVKLWISASGSLFIFFFFLVLMVDYGLLMVVSGVCSATVVGGGGNMVMVFSVKFVVVKQKE